MSRLRASEIARRRTEEEGAEAFFLCERRRRRRIHSAMREQPQKSGRGGGERRAERAEIVGGRGSSFQSREYRDVVAGDRPDVIAQRRVERVVELLDRHVDCDLQGRPPPGVGVRPGIGGSADQCDENVQIVGVLHGPGADHRVGEDDRVGFGPGDLLAAGRRVVEQVGAQV